MTLTQWFIFFLIVQAVHFAGTWKLYVRAGRKAWEAGVPIYNAVVLMGIINRPKWWTILLFVPIVNLIMIPVVWVETARSFGFNSFKDTALTVLTGGLYLYYINYATDAPHIKGRDINPKSSSGEWTSSLLFAIVAATIVHTYFMQPFVIPSSSLEKTLLVGDWLFVSKFHYGARTPITTVATPMLHDTIYGTKTKSYLTKPQLPYFRLPGFQDIERNDIVVFSWPVDTLVDITPGNMRGSVRKPIDKKSNYVKRAVGVPGDSLEVRDGYVYINGEKNDLPDRARIQFSYTIVSKELLVKRAQDANGNYVFPSDLMNGRYEISDIYLSGVQGDNGPYVHTAQASEASIEKLKNNSNIISIERTHYDAIENNKAIFGAKPGRASSVDNFGPIYIPEEGKTVAINPESLPYYKRIIEVYEGYEMGRERDITVNGNEILMNGEPLTEYTFEQDYYWLMGDNRHNSQDARAWGYVPFNHVVGKPVFVWFSKDANVPGLAGIRWDRVFTTVGGEGPLVSYRYWFLGALLLYIGWSFFRKKKQPKA
ncbi:signal peptidase I [Dokdonia donghaensis]|uniref:Signal peptidase I n=1 Tax=Dokdonia donghaensis DSW-1 TaxID=1300343 RepID=A0A0A2GVC9_9FLAO|nr:signal peptidase I [Dokdonia donghaensis]ANH61676.1 Signal peptidase I [Dokdonia donghaensis DSW-1]KGO06266.1 signal peptidase I [Dokdonia donghaensis DSW-1]